MTFNLFSKPIHELTQVHYILTTNSIMSVCDMWTLQLITSSLPSSLQSQYYLSKLDAHTVSP